MSTTDERLELLLRGETDALILLLGEIVTPFPVGMSHTFFLIGMDTRFRQTQTEEMFDLIASVLRERISTNSIGKGVASTD